MWAEMDWATSMPKRERQRLPLRERQPSLTMFSQETPGEWEQVVADRIGVLMRLPIGWDGYNGRPLTRGSAYIAMTLMATICTPKTRRPSLVPLPCGGVQIEWHRGPIDLEISVYSPGRISIYYCDGRIDGDGQEFEVTADYQPIIPMVRELDLVG